MMKKSYIQVDERRRKYGGQDDDGKQWFVRSDQKIEGDTPLRDDMV